MTAKLFTIALSAILLVAPASAIPADEPASHAAPGICDLLPRFPGCK